MSEQSDHTFEEVFLWAVTLGALLAFLVGMGCFFSGCIRSIRASRGNILPLAVRPSRPSLTPEAKGAGDNPPVQAAGGKVKFWFGPTEEELRKAEAEDEALLRAGTLANDRGGKRDNDTDSEQGASVHILREHRTFGVSTERTPLLADYHRKATEGGSIIEALALEATNLAESRRRVSPRHK